MFHTTRKSILLQHICHKFDFQPTLSLSKLAIFIHPFDLNIYARKENL